MKNRLAIRGRIEECWLWALRVPLEAVQKLTPQPLEPVSMGGLGFFNVVVCRLAQMRPNGLPGWLGIGYWHAAYRVYVRHGDLEGLHFLRSDSSSRLVAALGNLMTDYRFHHSRISAEAVDAQTLITVRGGVTLQAMVEEGDPGLADGSPFQSAAEADAFLKYKPAGVSVDATGRVSYVPILRDESAWRAVPVRTGTHLFSYLEPYGAVLERSYRLEPIEYVWDRAVPHP